MKMTVGIPADELKRVLEIKNGFLLGRMHGLESDALLQYLAGGGISGITPRRLACLRQTPGFYAREHECDEILEAWCKIYLKTLRDCDILVTLGVEEYNALVEDYYNEIYIWSCAQLHQWLPFLEDKRVLVISPFTKTIRHQHKTKDFAKVFENFGTLQKYRPPVVYPRFELLTVKAPNTVKGNDPFPHDNWLESFNELKQKVDALDFDIAIAGCGSYGMPIAHHVKTTGRGGIQAGSYAQVMFGIKGRRWKKQGWWNKHWVYPSPEETPLAFENIERGDYWGP